MSAPFDRQDMADQDAPHTEAERQADAEIEILKLLFSKHEDGS